MEPLRIFIGYDSKETVAYHVLCHSILRHASGPVAFIPLVQSALRTQGLYTRDRNPMESTEFSMTRFLVPYLSGYEGVSIFMDCDMVVQGDVYDLIEEPFIGEAVRCVQHLNYTPKTTTKFLGQAQTPYPRKNWSSLMVFDNAFCTILTPEYVNTASGLNLHRMLWAESVGSIDPTWNWLVGEYEPNPDAKCLHYTLGTPCFLDYATCDQSNIWWHEYELMRNPLAVIDQRGVANSIL
jgi:hypothetical protein